MKIADGTYIAFGDGFYNRLSVSAGFIVGIGAIALVPNEITPSALVQALGTYSGEFGVWTDSNLCYVDKVAIIADKSDALDMANMLGELAIWDAANAKEIRLWR